MTAPFGDWELDTIIGKGNHQAIVMLTERKSRFALLRKVEQRKAELVSDAVIDLLKPVTDRSQTITGDNGKEFSEHESIARELEIDFFFAHPFTTWERDANENMNGLVRQYTTKNLELVSVTEDELLQVINKLKHRPRKCLDISTPFEVFFEQYVALTS